MTLLTRLFLTDYARNPTNLIMLGVVPVVFVMVVAGTMSDAARLLGGADEGTGISTVTAGWVAAFLAAVAAMYFQVTSARATDGRLFLAGLSRRRLVGARVLTGGILALLAVAAAVAALAFRGRLDQPVRIIVGTMLFAAGVPRRRCDGGSSRPQSQHRHARAALRVDRGRVPRPGPQRIDVPSDTGAADPFRISVDGRSAQRPRRS